MNILAVDPGGATGWAYFVGPKIKAFDTVKTTDKNRKPFFEWVANIGMDYPVDVLVVENYIIRPPKKTEHGTDSFDHRFNTGWTLRCCGALMFRAHQLDIPCVFQNSAIKKAASKLAYGTEYVKKDNIHYWDASLHGVYYLMTVLNFKRKDLGVYSE